ncbi:MFS transporter [Clostridium sp. WILCCON 0269]|uniref:MFS transporter n=1 Tax=Candidatus Clostridium eludens TaxID=3381663 RepID=A0ABW8SII4_9CLOT
MKHTNKHRWAILSVVTLVSFITNVDSTIVVIGLPKLMQGLHASIIIGLWSITSYIITSTVFLLPAGRWSDMVGKKRIFISGFTVFTVATVLCGVAGSGASLILFRFIQGIGAALALSTATPIIIETFPQSELGFAIGVNSTSWVLGAIMGPVVGGALINFWGWRSIFFVTVPFALIGIITATFVLKNDSSLFKFRTDWAGILTFGAGLTLFLIVLSEGQSWGWFSPLIITLTILIVVCWTAFTLIEKKVKFPLFDLQLFKNGRYTIGLIMEISYCIGYFSITFLLTIYLQGALHLNALNARILLIPLSAPQLIMGPFGGKLADRFGTMRLLIIGFIFLTIGMFFMGNLGVELSLTALIPPLIVISIANSLAWPSFVKTVLSQVPQEHTGAASGMFFTVYNASRALSQTFVLLAIELGVSSTVVTRALVGLSKEQSSSIVHILVYSTNTGFRIFTSFFVIALILVLFLAFTNKQNQMREDLLTDN